MNNWIIFAILAWISMWSWGFFHDKSTSLINPIVWATLVSFVAMIIWLVVIYSNKEINFEIVKNSINYKAIFFIILVSISAFLLDYFTLKTFSTWINISTWFIIIVVVSVITSVILWIFLVKENINFLQILWIIFSIIWIYLILKK